MTWINIIQKYMHMDNMHTKRYSTSLFFRKIWFKTAKRYHFTPTQMTVINNDF